MNSEKLVEWYTSHRQIYEDLSAHCGSVSELMFRLEIYGNKWTKWDWVMFLSYLDFSSNYTIDSPPSWSPPYNSQQDQNESMPEKLLLNDIFNEIDNGSLLDNILTNKTVIMNIIEWLSTSQRQIPAQKHGLLRLLSHIFKKFPSLWKMNWMFIKHKNGNGKTHRLAYTMPKIIRRSAKYFESNAFLEDFISKHWGEPYKWYASCSKDDSI